MNLQAKFGEQEMKINAPFKSITVVESVKPVYQEKTVTPTEEEQRVVADAGFDAIEAVNVKPIPSEYIVPSGELEITENGSFDIKNYASAKVNVQSGDTLKTLLDATKSAHRLFYMYKGTTVDGLIPYSATESVTTMEGMFHNCPNIISVPLFDTKNVATMFNMFASCSNLATVPLFDTRNVTNMNGLFSSCSNLTAVPLFNTSNVTNLANFAYGCRKLTEVHLLDTSKVTIINSLFSGCVALKKITLEKISSAVTQSSSLFYNCKALQVIYFKDAISVPTLSSSGDFSPVPSTCKVVVPDALYDTWTTATNWSAINVTWVKESEYTEE